MTLFGCITFFVAYCAVAAIFYVVAVQAAHPREEVEDTEGTDADE